MFTPVLLVHEEHDALQVPAGVSEVRRQREYTPQRASLVNTSLVNARLVSD